MNENLSRKEEIFPQRSGKDWVAYRGQPGLIIAIDIGTTYSGASYCILQPGKKPVIEDVKSFPGQQTSAGKVPSIVLYDAYGTPCLFGAEAVDGSSAHRLLDQGGKAAKWWKLYLKPKHLDLIVDENTGAEAELQPLPFDTKAESIVAQFLAYMSSCVGRYIISRHSNGVEILQTYADNVRYVVTIPNGWELPQQNLLRNACVEAQLVTAQKADMVAFVSEAEASINFCTHSSGTTGWLEEAGQQVIVCDAGGGTIDISTYEVHAISPRLILTETSVSDCLIAGSTLVDRRAMNMLRQRLAGTEWDNEADLEDLQQRFCSSIKEAFSDPSEEQYLAIASAGVNRDEPLIRRGKLILSGADVAALFEPSISATVKSIEARVAGAKVDGVPVAMVGGFSESSYFRDEVQARLGKKVKLCKPDEATSKAVSSGAVAWLIDGAVGMRVAKLTYGISCSILYRESRSEHVARRSNVYAGKDGRLRLAKAFGAVLYKGQTHEEGKTFTEPFIFRWDTGENLSSSVSLMVYRGESERPPEFLDEPGFEELCQFKVDMAPFKSLMQPIRAPQGTYYYEVPIKLAMKLCGTEITAQVLFQHGGQTYGGPVVAVTDHQMSN